MPELCSLAGWQSNTDTLKPCSTVTHCISQNAEPGFLAELPPRDFNNYCNRSNAPLQIHPVSSFLSQPPSLTVTLEEASLWQRFFATVVSLSVLPKANTL
ncbi:hypothetical protein I312_103907 [Cryptococcus bacillisporus CA1280]|uniref:uncharacterized protein n=1 Tax=Cryptococcus bacillisporus CA1280 TaxID=1296109 RepID=UPI00336707A4